MSAAPVLLALAFGGVLMHLLPTMSRPDIFFAVTVPYEFRLDVRARGIRRDFWVLVWGATALAALMAVFGPKPGSALPAMAIQFVSCWIAWAVAHRRVKPFARTVAASAPRIASLEPRTSGIPGGWLVAAGPLLIIAGAAVFMWINWNQIPERFASRWSADGTPIGWRTRTPWGVFRPLVTSAAVTMAMLWNAYAISTKTRQVAPTGQASLRERRFKKGNALYLVVSAYMMALLFVGTTVRPLFAHTDRLPTSVWILLAVVVVGSLAMIAWMYWIGQGGRRGMPADEAGIPPGDGTPDDGWKAGLIYFNPADPAIFVEKRVGFGWTLNFGRPVSWLIMAAILAATLGPVLLLRKNR